MLFLFYEPVQKIDSWHGESSVSLEKIILMFTELCFIELSLLCYQCRKIK